MKYIDKYRDERIARRLAREIAACASRRWVLMEICGDQTHTIMRYGLDELLPAHVERCVLSCLTRVACLLESRPAR